MNKIITSQLADLLAGANSSFQAMLDLLKNKEGYILLFHEIQIISGAEVLFAYYVKKSDYPMFPLYLKEDNDRRAYCFSYIYNKNTGGLFSGLACRLSKKASRCAIENWAKIMDAKVTAIEAMESQPRPGQGTDRVVFDRSL
jgi:hypothetical protein